MNTYKRGSAGGVILIIIGVILAIFLLGVIVKTYKSAGFGSGLNPAVNSTASGPKTTSAPPANTPGMTAPPSSPQYIDYNECRMVIDAPENGASVASPFFFRGRVIGCGNHPLYANMGTIGLYNEDHELISNLVTLKAGEPAPDSTISFSGFFSPEINIRLEKGYVKWTHLKPNGSTDNGRVTIYY